MGNLGDITLRAIEILKKVDLALCEDTRQTAKLLNHYGIVKPLAIYFQHSRLSKIDYIAEQLASGKNIGLVTDAGTPGISDPGEKLVEELISRLAGLKIVPIPGPCAAIAALSVAGFPADKFVFMGFPPHKKGRETYFRKIAAAEETVVFYESPHRILKTLEQINILLPLAEIMVGRELTKMFETVYRGAPAAVIVELKRDKNNLKGEFTVVVKKHE